MFERTLSDFYLQRWLEHLPESERPDAIAHARQPALRHDDLFAAATLLLQLGDAAAAEARLLAEPWRIDGKHDGNLVPLTNAVHDEDRPGGDTVVHRALLKGILDRAYARATGSDWGKSRAAESSCCPCRRTRNSRPRSSPATDASWRSGPM